MSMEMCTIKECGARVIVLTVEGRPFRVNPNRLELVIPVEGEQYRVATGFQPHYLTCVNISGRRRPAGPDGG